MLTSACLAQTDDTPGNEPTGLRKNQPRSLRSAVEGEWLPTLLPSNDLTDPPRNYQHCVGGACFGMTTLTYALWCCPQQKEVMTADDFAATVIRTVLPNPNGRFVNYALSRHVAMAGKVVPITDKTALIHIAELVQNKIQPGGGVKKTPREVREFFRTTKTLPGRITTTSQLALKIEQAGGRLVMGLLFFNQERTEMAGHAVIFTLGKGGRVSVWDPNAQKTDEARGSGQPAPLVLRVAPFGRIQSVRYRIDLPDGREQQRVFNFLYPITTFINIESKAQTHNAPKGARSKEQPDFLKKPGF